MESNAGSLQGRLIGDLIEVSDTSCGSCATCAAGYPVACLSPDKTGPTVLRITGSDARAVLRRLTASAAFCAAGVAADAVVLCLDDDDLDGPTLSEYINRAHAGPTVSASTTNDPVLRARLSELRKTGRADVVVATRDASSAVKAVARGSSVCLAHDEILAPTITELVQREVTLIAARDVRDFTNIARDFGSSYLEDSHVAEES